MIKGLIALAQPLLLRLDPETAHRLTLKALQALPFAPPKARDPKLAVKAFGLAFANPLGLAAGFDKNAQAVAGLLSAGFGFVEVGTLTPLPQSGNPAPRLFRLVADGGVINRLGFNNFGYETARERLAAERPQGILGVNVGPNRDAADRIADYCLGVKTFAPLASYFTINISSPNTPGLRDLQRRDGLDALIARVLDAREAQAQRRPVLIKIAPDLGLDEIDDIVDVARRRRIDGIIVSNTTIGRPPTLKSPQAREAGGLSGRPLFALATQCLAQVYLRVEGDFPLIGCGGIDSVEAAATKMEAGASLLQLYTALIYRGPALIEEILLGLSRLVEARGLSSVAELTGSRARDWAGAR